MEHHQDPRRALVAEYSRTGRRTRALSWMFILIALFLSLVTARSIFLQNIQFQRERIQLTGAQLVQGFDHELNLYRFAIESLDKSAQQFLNGASHLSDDPVKQLKPLPAQHGYALFAQKDDLVASMGNLTGLGLPPKPGSALAEEMEMAVGLTPLFESTLRFNHELPWAYYTSAQDFVYLYPGVGPQDYFYSPTLKQKEFFVLAKPEENPERKVFWTHMYEDEGGKGQMVTISKPIYRQNQFLGSISLDVGLNTLSWLLGRHMLADSTAFLVNANGEVMVSNKNDTKKITLPQQANKRYVRLGEYEYAIFPLTSTDWKVVIQTSHNAMLYNALKLSVLYGALVLLMLAGILLIVWLTNTMRLLHSASMTDFLTNLHNRRYFDEIAQQEFASARRNGGYVVLAVLDVDFFKKYNDAYGHQAGDAALKTLADCLRETFKRATDKIFRMGGEEFALLIHLDNPEQLYSMTELLRTQLKTMQIQHTLSPFGELTVSVGAVLVGGDNWKSVDQAYACADNALYRAKANGRNLIELDLGNT